MGIFGRRGKDGDKLDEDGTGDAASTDAATTDAATLEVDDLGEASGVTGDPGTEASPDGDDPLSELDEVTPDESFSRARGPFDVSEVAEIGEADTQAGRAESADSVVDRLDLGALRFVPIDGMQLRLEVDEASDTVLSVHALHADSSVQLQAFAAPRTLPVWPDIRDEIAESIVAQGGTADVVRGPLGRELLCRMPQRGPDGRTVFAQVRFAGVDGPRWFLRAVFSGPAAIDDTAAAPFVELVRSAVVVRGDDAMPPREVLPLRMPLELQPTPEGGDPDGAEGAEAPESSTVRADDLKPFERGPEITEVR